MKYNVYAVFDEAARVFKYDFKRMQYASHAEAIRYFGDGVKAEKTELAVHPQDFSLFLLAEYDDTTGVFLNVERPERLARGTDFILPSPVSTEG